MEPEKGPPKVVKEAFTWVSACDHPSIFFDYSRKAWTCDVCGLTISELDAQCMWRDAHWAKVRGCQHEARFRNTLKLDDKWYSHCTACGALLRMRDI